MLMLLSKLLLLWITLSVIIILIAYYKFRDSLDSKFFRIGPHSDLFIIGININNITKYLCLILFCFINDFFREINKNFINPWLINNIQNVEKEKKSLIKNKIHFINSIYVLFVWFDWFISINMVTTQIDLFVLETLISIIIANISVWIYLNPKFDLQKSFIEII